MKIVAIYPNPEMGCAWTLQQGLVRSLLRLGHTVTVCEIPTHKISPQNAKAWLPPVSYIAQHDTVILSGPEHLYPFISEAYGPTWGYLKVPRIAWYHESFDRQDVRSFDTVKLLSDFHFFPAKADAVKFGGHWAPFAVDTTIFHPAETHRDIPLGFVGVIYDKRRRYLDGLRPELSAAGYHLQTANVVVWRGTEVNHLASTQRYADQVRRMKLFFNLPTLSSLHVSKVVEVLACGTCLLTPRVIGEETLFRTPVFETPLLDYYEPDDLLSTVQKIRFLLANNATRTAMGKAAAAHVRNNHDIDKRLQEILSVV